MKSPKMVWCGEQPNKRNQFCLFLRRFHLASIPCGARIYLFADSLYRLRINGKIIGFGPARFLPNHPEYDTYDITNWLQVGQNSILVEVCSRGEPCYQAAASRGGFIAWGKVGDSVDLHTPGNWLVQLSDAWEPHAEPYSFAQSAIEILDAEKLPPGYPEFPNQEGEPGEWSASVEVENPQHWGALSPRSIAMPSLDVLRPQRVLIASAVRDGYVRVGFNARNERAGGRQPFFTHIFSPTAQSVEIGLFWGPTFLNGQKLPHTHCANRGNRQNAVLQLRPGWNFFMGMPATLRACWTWMMEFPQAPGLIVRALPDQDCKYTFGLGPFVESLEDEQNLSAPGSLDGLPGYPGDWRLIRSEIEVCSPARAMAWDIPSKALLPAGDYREDLVLDASGEAAMIALDMGTEFLGHVEVAFQTDHGVTLDIGYADVQESNGRISLYRSNPFVNSADRYICGSGAQTITTYHERGGRFLQLTFRGRPGCVRIHRVNVIQKMGAHPVIGTFRCDDALLNWTWKTGIATVRACMSDGWNDGPWRERGMYIGDALITAAATRKFTGDWSMEPWAIRLWARGQFPSGQIPDVVPSEHETPLCDYTLLWIVLVRNYWAATGDADTVRNVWPTIERVFNSSTWKAGLKGLWEVPDKCGIFIDRSVLREERQGVNGALNAFRIRALESAAEMARAIGLRDEAKTYTSEAAGLRKVFREVFWDDDARRFSAALIDGHLFTGRSLHVNTLALAFGLAGEEQEAGVLEYLKQEMPSNTDFIPGYLELYFLYYLLQGLYRVGEAGFAETVIREHYRLMRERGAVTFWEHLQAGIQIPSINSVCHGWAASPVIFFSERVLGVRELVPGDVSRVLIAPESDTLREAEGRVPHPLGIIGVSWHIKGRCLLISVDLPSGVSATIRPVGRLAELELVRCNAVDKFSSSKQPSGPPLAENSAQITFR